MDNKTIKFKDCRKDIIKAIEDRKDDLNINESVNLIDGFINQPVYQEVSGNAILGSATIPTIAVVGKNSGRIYSFPLQALLPDLDFK